MPDAQGLLETVGRRGDLHLVFERDASRTVISHSSCTSPWHYFPPCYLDDSGCAYTWLINPSGGLVGGDHLSVGARLGAEAHVVMTSPSATKVYRSPSAAAVQRISLEVGSDAVLEWMPEPTIPYADSQFVQTIHVTLAPRATLLLWDGMASGRVAREERWAFAGYHNEIRIADSSGGVVIERFSLQPDSIGRFMRDWDYVASLFVVSEGIEPPRWLSLKERLAVALESMGGEVLGGASELSLSGLVIKVLARSAPALMQAQELLWGCVRRELFGFALPTLRRY